MEEHEWELEAGGVNAWLEWHEVEAEAEATWDGEQLERWLVLLRKGWELERERRAWAAMMEGF